jgi:hypothetical protein
MASETIKAFLMITLFCGLQAALNLPRPIDSETVKRWRQAMMLHRPHWPAHGPISYAVTPVRGWAQVDAELGVISGRPNGSALGAAR